MSEKRTKSIEVSWTGNGNDSLAIGFSLHGENGTWCGEEIKLIAVTADRNSLGDIVKGLLDQGGDFRTSFWYRALLVTERHTLYVESENDDLTSQLLPHHVWTPDAITSNRNVYVTLPGLDPLNNDTHAIVIGMVIVAQGCRGSDDFFKAVLPMPKKKSWYQRFLEWID